MFTFSENFKCYDEEYIPYGIEVEAATHLWHKHVRPCTNGMAISAPANKYFLKAPTCANFDAEYTFSFNYVTDFAAMTLYFGYDRDTFTGYELNISWSLNDESIELALVHLVHDRDHTKVTKKLPLKEFPYAKKLTRVRLNVKSGVARLTIGDSCEADFEVEELAGAIGFSRPNFIGEIIYSSATVSVDITQTCESKAKVVIPLHEGGTMPLTVEYKHFTVGGKSYVTATLDGGPQYRKDYEYYDPDGKKEQYVVEQWYLTKPYVSINNRRYYLSMEKIATSDGLHWKGILDVYLGMVDFPISRTFPADSVPEEYSFGYEHCFIKGFASQQGAAEYRYSPEGDYLGMVTPPDTFELVSPEDKYAVSMIEDTVYDYETVREHFKRAHYFADDEIISFSLCKNTDKKYLSYKASLCDVFGDKIEELELSPDGSFSHSALPVGVYRIAYTVLYGDKELTSLDTVFEVYDKSGEKCAPTESGLPILYSTPNEQKYLDRDKFDPWNPGKPSNQEHFYSLSSFLGYIGERKRVWEVISKFGRKWYAWLTRRIYGSHSEATPEKHPEVARHASYLRYDHDFLGGVYCYWAGKNTVEFIEDFLDSREGAREAIGHNRDEKYTLKENFNLISTLKGEFFDAFVEEAVRRRARDLEILRSYNPDIKLAGYGPFQAYASHLRSYSLLEYFAFPTDERLKELFFSGFCQFEDYPASCAYQTYRGPFGVGTTLAKIPTLVFYPEQYKSGRGGCIDGHVKHANPPLGKYDMPLWFNTTLARDYVYNTAVKSKDGYRFWDTYGFMHSDHPEEQDDVFIRDWKYIVRHKPASMKRSPIFFAEFPREESIYEAEFATRSNWHVYYNPSEEGIAHIYECMRSSGLPMGSYAVWDALDTLTAEDTDLLVLPSTTPLSPERIAKIRKLYSEGVSLMAVGRVDGLEDLFGVRYAPHRESYTAIDDGKLCESIYPYTDSFNYAPDGAEAILCASGNPVLMRHGRTAILNVAAYSIGRIHFNDHPYLGRTTNSELFKRTTEAVLASLVQPTAVADSGVGITHLSDSSGNDILVLIDYSNHDGSKIDVEHEYTVRLNCDYSSAEAIDNKPLRQLSSDGRLDAIAVTLRQHESAIVKLIK